MTSSGKKSFYAVVKGRRPGVYTRWTGKDGAEEQVKGFPGALYRGFATLPEAEYFLRTGKAASNPTLLADKGAGQTPASATDDYHLDLEAGKVVIFTDGASTGNPGPGGYGAVLLFGKTRKELSGGFRCTTNNRMELLAVITALETLKQPAQVVLYSDSRYVVNAVTLGWARRWKARGWMRDSVNRAENADLWEALLPLLDLHAVTFLWVKGHASNPENERCDRLAVQAAHRKDLPVDAGYEGHC